MYLEVSAKTGDNVMEVWNEIVRELRHKKHEEELLSGIAVIFGTFTHQKRSKCNKIFHYRIRVRKRGQ
jgi:hypothetical protein